LVGRFIPQPPPDVVLVDDVVDVVLVVEVLDVLVDDELVLVLLVLVLPPPLQVL